MTTATLPVINAALGQLPAEEQATGPVRFHLSLNVSDLTKSVVFYQAILGVEPAKCRPDYAKFELHEPPLVLSLEPHAPGSSGILNHAGFRFPNAQTLVDVQRRLEMAGIATQREDGVECCYSRQTKFWARDPDECLWEFYVLEEDIEHRGAGQSAETIPAPSTTRTPATPASSGPAFEHRMGSPIPESIPGEAGTYGEIRLRGTLNMPLDVRQPQAILAEAFRALKSGGQVQMHLLTASSGFKNGPPQLPGPAATVKSVPVDRDMLTALEQAGFREIVLTKFNGQPCFQFDGVEMRETMIVARKPLAVERATAESRVVVYRGPFSSITDETGRTYRRGERVAVSASTHDALTNAAPEQFTTLDAPASGDAVHCH